MTFTITIDPSKAGVSATKSQLWASPGPAKGLEAILPTLKKWHRQGSGPLSLWLAGGFWVGQCPLTPTSDANVWKGQMDMGADRSLTQATVPISFVLLDDQGNASNTLTVWIDFSSGRLAEPPPNGNARIEAPKALGQPNAGPADMSAPDQAAVKAPPPTDLPQKPGIKKGWKPWASEVGALDGGAPKGGLSADYLPYLKRMRTIRTTILYTKDGKQDILHEMSCSYEGDGLIKVQTTLMITPRFRIEGAGMFGPPTEEYYTQDDGFIKIGRKSAEKLAKKADMHWERVLKIGAYPWDSWQADPADRNNGSRTLIGFGKYKGQTCAVIAMEAGFYILVRGSGEVLRRSFFDDDKISVETRYQ
jgi:hypothetical protein